MYDEVDESAVVAVLSGLVATDVSTACEAELGAAMRGLRRVRGWLDAFETAVAVRSEGLRQDGRGRGPESLLTRNARVSEQQARRTVRRAAVLSEAPAMRSALMIGAVSVGHVDAFTDATRRASPTGRAALVARQHTLAGLAATQSPEEFAHSCHRVTVLADADGGLGEFERQRRSCRLRRFVDEASGMFKLSGQFDPELGIRVWRAIDHTVAVNYPPEHRPETTPEGPEAADHLAALALADVISVAYHDVDKAPQDPSGPMCRPPRGEFTVLADLRTLTDGLHERSIIEVDPGGVQLPVETLRRLACEADLLPVVLDGHGVAVDVGRSKRLATVNQRHALRAMYPSCAISECRTPFDHCEVHHLDPFGGVHGTGQTNLDALIPLCSRHHHAAHEGRWQLELDPTTRQLIVTLPDGPRHTHPPPRANPAA